MFDLLFPETVEDAVSAQKEGARWFAGGSDLIPQIKSDLAAPTRLVNLKRVHELRGVHTTDEGVRIGALTTLTEISEHQLIREKYRALAQACELAASPQICNVATISGNLCQDSRCAYFRSGFDCLLRGGEKCFMRAGENREAAVIGYHDCVHVHPSDPANALAAFDAQIVARGRAGERVIGVQEFFRAPDAQDKRMNVLRAEEMITAIVLPNLKENSRSVYVKAMDRAAWAFALVSVCVKLEVGSWKSEVGNRKVESARVVLGGVAPTPWREFRVEKKLLGAEWNTNLVTQGEFDVLEDAQPLAHNGYKVRLARGLVRRALRECLPTDAANGLGNLMVTRGGTRKANC